MAKPKNLADSGIRGEYKIVPVGEIVPDPDNYNKQSRAVYAKLLASIRKFGFTDPLIVRRNPDGEGYMIVGGQHRHQAARELGLPAVPVIDLGEMSAADAHAHLITLNETKGSADQDALASLVQSIKLDGGDEALEVLPFNDAQLADLLDGMGEVELDEDDDSSLPLPTEKPTKLKASDIGGAFELEGATQKDYIRVLEAIRRWRVKKPPEVPAWRLLCDTLEKG